MEKFDENLICMLCSDYLVDAVTLTRCLHFFCRSCLLKYLKKQNRCPKCFQDLGNDLKAALRCDQDLQNLVYKLVPNFFWKQLKRVERTRVTSSEKSIIRKNGLLQLSSRLCGLNEKVSFVLEYIPLTNLIYCEKIPDELERHLHTDVRFYDPYTSMTISQTSEASISFRRYFRCPARASIVHLKKLLEIKFLMADTYAVYFVDGELRNILEDDLTLQDLIYLYHWKRDRPLPILFTLARLATDEEDQCKSNAPTKKNTDSGSESLNRNVSEAKASDEQSLNGVSTHTKKDRSPVLDAEEMPSLGMEEQSIGLREVQLALKSIDRQIPQLIVQLSPSSFEQGTVHPPIIKIITTEQQRNQIVQQNQPPTRKRRKSNAPTKKNMDSGSESLNGNVSEAKASDEQSLSTHILSTHINGTLGQIAPISKTSPSASKQQALKPLILPKPPLQHHFTTAQFGIAAMPFFAPSPMGMNPQFPFFAGMINESFSSQPDLQNTFRADLAANFAMAHRMNQQNNQQQPQAQMPSNNMAGNLSSGVNLGNASGTKKATNPSTIPKVSHKTTKNCNGGPPAKKQAQQVDNHKLSGQIPSTMSTASATVNKNSGPQSFVSQAHSGHSLTISKSSSVTGEVTVQQIGTNDHQMFKSGTFLPHPHKNQLLQAFNQLAMKH